LRAEAVLGVQSTGSAVCSHHVDASDSAYVQAVERRGGIDRRLEIAGAGAVHGDRRRIAR
jgi:hypothetical protein